MINSNPLVLVGRKTLEAKTLPELVAWMKKNPARMGHPGVGSTGHLATALLAQALGIEVTHIPYRGAAPMLQDTLGGHIDLFFATPQQVVGQFASGEVKVFGITSKDPSPQFPGVPSFVATYGPKLDIDFWQIMLAPAGTPKPIVDALDGALQEALDDPEILKVWAAQRHGALSQGAAHARGRDGLSQERDRPLGPGRARQQDRSAGELAGRSSRKANS